MTDDFMFNQLKTRIVLLVLGGKGGIGKSFMAQIAAAILRERGRVLLIDTDHSNSTTKTIEKEALMLDIWSPEARGPLTVALEDLAAGQYQHIVIDTGAQEDAPFIDLLQWLTGRVAKAGGVLVALLPISLSTHNQRAAVTFMATAYKQCIPVVFVKNYGQGRSPADYARWEGTQARAQAIESGAVETAIANVGARWADEAGGFGMSLMDAAQSLFDKAGQHAKAAEAVFTRDIRAWLNIFITEAGEGLAAAISAAIEKRRLLDGRAKGPDNAQAGRPKS